MKTPPFTPVLRSQLDVEQMWITLIKPLGWHCPRFYFIAVGADSRPLPVVNELDELPTPLSADDADRFVALLADVMGEVGAARWALLFCRPGPGGLTEADRRACAKVYQAARSRGVPLEVIHVATDTLILPATMDDVAA